VEGADTLPEVRGDVILMKTDEELVPRYDWGSQFDVTEQDDSRVGNVGAFMLVGDVGKECVDGVEGLPIWLTRPLGGCK
jgi:hypothetical protein